MYIFLDESGNFTGDKGECFVVGGFVTGNHRATAKAFRNWQHSKFRNKKLRYRSEVKFTDTRLTDELRAQTLRFFTEQDIRIFYAFLKTKNIPLEYQRKGNVETGKLYTHMIAHTLGLLLPSTESEFSILIDQRQLKKVPRAEFRETIKARLLFELPKGSAVRVDMIDSSTNPNIQIADWFCGALYRYHTNRQAGDKFYEIMRGSIIKSTELFKDFWGEFHNKKAPSERCFFAEWRLLRLNPEY